MKGDNLSGFDCLQLVSGLINAVVTVFIVLLGLLLRFSVEYFCTYKDLFNFGFSV